MSRETKIEQAIELLRHIGMPRAQLNERSALCLLALLDVKPDDSWQDARSPMLGITPIMDWSKEYYLSTYAPNSRETFRRQTMHQFVEAGIALYNPDEPERPVNSPKAVYQIEPEFLTLAKEYGSSEWQSLLTVYLSKRTTLADKYARAREQVLIPVTVNEELTLKLSSGQHSLLIKQIIGEFGARFAPGSRLVYVGDTGSKWGYFDKELLASKGVILDNHGKMPDVVLYDGTRDWFLLIESVTSHGPVDGKRYTELNELFKNSTAGIVLVTALPSRSLLARFLPVIAWETEVWVSDSPSHLIHFNGDKFLGPHEKSQE